MPFEHRTDPLLSKPKFYYRLARSFGYGLGLIAFSLAIGILGYRYLAELSWIDAFLNAAMILSGMGPVAELHTTAAKLFAGLYAIYSGVALISTAGIIFAPLIHRLLHRFHLEHGKKD